MSAGAGSTGSQESSSPLTLRSIEPNALFNLLDLEGAGLQTFDRDEREVAWQQLLDYFRERWEERSPDVGMRGFGEADELVVGVMRFAHYPPVTFAPGTIWQADPVGDIEWVAKLHRFLWAVPLAEAYAATSDEQYARTWIAMTLDWIAHHPLEQSLRRTHPAYPGWDGYAWLDIQTGKRASSLARTLPLIARSPSLDGPTFARILASLYDHQAKSIHLPRPDAHNKSMMELRGIVDIAQLVPDFRETGAWLEIIAERLVRSLEDQVTPGGVQREWCGGYHLSVFNDTLALTEALEHFGVDVPSRIDTALEKMANYMLAMLAPDLGFPRFGDTKRPAVSRHQHLAYMPLHKAAERWRRPEFASVAYGQAAGDHDWPQQNSFAFPDAGHYVMRDRWGDDAIYFALHCTPPSLSQAAAGVRTARGHDEPDNGTFELYAFGRWLMTDTGFYVYPGSDQSSLRDWHRQTCVHQTLTRNLEDSFVEARHVLWHDEPDCAALVVENQSYEDMAHRRSVWFVDNRFFVLLDEAIGTDLGELHVHFQFAPGPLIVDTERHHVRTAFEDVNVLLAQPAEASVVIEAVDGWFSEDYGQRAQRQGVRIGHTPAGRVPWFITVLLPFKGRSDAAPQVSFPSSAVMDLGAGQAEVMVAVDGQTWRLHRNCADGTMGAEHVDAC